MTLKNLKKAIREKGAKCPTYLPKLKKSETYRWMDKYLTPNERREIWELADLRDGDDKVKAAEELADKLSNELSWASIEQCAWFNPRTGEIVIRLSIEDSRRLLRKL